MPYAHGRAIAELGLHKDSGPHRDTGHQRQSPASLKVPHAGDTSA